MELALLFEGLSVAASVGLGCGTCCGSGAGILLSGYVMSHARDTRQSLAAFMAFFLGKVAGVAALCLVSSAVGQAVFSEGNPLSMVWVDRGFDLFMMGMGAWFVRGWVCEARGGERGGERGEAHGYQMRGDKACASRARGERMRGKASGGEACSSKAHGERVRKACGGQAREDSTCGSEACGCQCRDHHKMREAVKDGIHMPALFAAGAGFGITPCAPLIVVLGLCVTLPVGYATLTGAAFACASIASPLLLVLLLSGILTVHMHREIPDLIRWVRLACYLGMVGFFLFDLVQTL